MDEHEIIAAVAAQFRSFGGGKANGNNPLSMALKDSPPQFAAGVDIGEVVRFIRMKERERIAAALDEEADVIPCAEDAMVTRSNARLVRADFSYEDADRLAEEEDRTDG